MRARDLDTAMSIIAVIFVVSVFLLTSRAAQDIIMIGAFIAAPTKFIAIARCLEVLKGVDKINDTRS